MSDAARLRSRVRGALLGAAVGDALGAPFEGSSGGQLPEPEPLRLMAYTDDTHMTLATARSSRAAASTLRTWRGPSRSTTRRSPITHAHELGMEGAALQACAVASLCVLREARRPLELDPQKEGRLSRMAAIEQQAMLHATQRRREARRIQIDAALARLEAGEYGRCSRCGEGIEPKRLEFDPAVSLCGTCLRLIESRRR